jgi:cyclopropane fatty-acyl-phospholipid synthase-like methyltransferase
MSSDRWIEFWQEYGRTPNADEQAQVLRTRNGQPIAPERWQFTLHDLDSKFPVGPEDDLLDLCCGNGLFTRHFAQHCSSVVAVDISADLLGSLDRRRLPHVITQQGDIRKACFAAGAFSRILLYAGVQHLSEGEAVALFRDMFCWLRPGGLLFVGDIPDRNRLWSFYNTPERRVLYFDNCITDHDVVGTWYEAEWLVQLAQSIGFRQVEAIPQPPELINAHFRFDLKVIR